MTSISYLSSMSLIKALNSLLTKYTDIKNSFQEGFLQFCDSYNSHFEQKGDFILAEMKNFAVSSFRIRLAHCVLQLLHAG